MHRATVVLLSWSGLGLGCGDPQPLPSCRDDGGAACFQLPTAPLAVPDGPADIGCAPLVPQPAPTAVTIRGDIAGFGSNAPLAGAEIRLFGSPDFTQLIASAISASDATYELTLPQGTPDLMWGTAGASDYLTTYLHAFRPNLGEGDISDFNVRIFKPANVEGAAILVKEDWDPATAVVAGFARDCERRPVEHAAVVLSSTPGQRTFVAGASVYYGAPGAVPLAVPPEERGDTNTNGVFAVFRVPPGSASYLQAWGFPDAAAVALGEAGLVLYAEHPVHAVAGGVVQINLWVNQ
jgi:hypothetical protein